MDPYARLLAKHLAIPTLWTDIYEKDDFGVPLLSRFAARMAWEQLGFVRVLRGTRQPLHFPNQHFGRYGHFLSVPYIVTVHDLIRYFDLTSSDPLINRPDLRDRLYLRMDYAGIRKATAVIAISNTTRDDLVHHLRIPPQRVFVTYQGIDHSRFRKVERRLVDGPYILFVGNENPRKNLRTLLKAFRLLKKTSRFNDLKLVKVGAAGGVEAPFRQRTLADIAELGLGQDVIFTERVPDDDLPVYYSGAQCMVLPSLYEGFGFPPLEAMACGCPVIVSNAGSLPEVVGDAAMVIDARDSEGLAGALLRVLTNDQLRLTLINNGLRRAREFSWEQTAEDTLKVYRTLGLAE